MWGSNPSRIPRYPRPPFSSTMTFELIRWLRRESGLIIGPRRCHGGGVLKGLREDQMDRSISFRPVPRLLSSGRSVRFPKPAFFPSVSVRRIDEEAGISEDVHAHDH